MGWTVSVTPCAFPGVVEVRVDPVVVKLICWIISPGKWLRVRHVHIPAPVFMNS
ncbi:hypothetical protein L509_4145 [Bordetella bronchiseptica M85/00/2]|nr:hypothetical protein L509_4145 [Bordetella bronchiseptica M85/00/2]